MDKEWLKFDRRGKRYQEGARNFANAARARSGHELDMIICPCFKCRNLQRHHFDIVYEHIVIKGFDPNYKTWFLHGERPTQCDDVEMHKETDIKNLVREAEAPLLSDCINDTKPHQKMNGAPVNEVVCDDKKEQIKKCKVDRPGDAPTRVLGPESHEQVCEPSNGATSSKKAYQQSEQGNHHILDQPIDYENAKCQLLHWYNFEAEEVVAEGRIDSVDPHSKVDHDMHLGRDSWKVWVDLVFDKDLLLYRPTNKLNKLGEALGTTVAWPKSSIKLI